LTRRIKLVVSYDGTEFRGWAAQSGQRTVQSTLTEAVREVSRENIEITGASRTDSGAHAKGQVCHFDTKTSIEDANWKRALNRVLPSDLAVVEASRVAADFHSRFWALDRYYRYRFLLEARDPFRGRFAFESEWRLDVNPMQEAASALVGEHDFRAFTEELDPAIENTRRTLFSVEVKQVRDEIWLDVVGTAFLRGMMRRMAGGLFEVGRGKRSVGDIAKLLEDKGSGKMQLPVVLPARGLTLMKVRYGRHPAQQVAQG
jgi:tRNA pseudouridine38-40 synthase